MHTTLYQISRRKDQLEFEVSTAKGKIAELRADLDAARAENTRLQEERAMAVARVDALRDDLDRSRAATAEAQAKLQELLLSSAVKSRDGELAEATQALSRIQLANAQRERDDALRSLDEAKRELAARMTPQREAELARAARVLDFLPSVEAEIRSLQLQLRGSVFETLMEKAQEEAVAGVAVQPLPILDRSDAELQMLRGYADSLATQKRYQCAPLCELLRSVFDELVGVSLHLNLFYRAQLSQHLGVGTAEARGSRPATPTSASGTSRPSPSETARSRR